MLEASFHPSRQRCTGLHASHERELAQRRHPGRLAVLLRPACYRQAQEGRPFGLLALARTHSLRMATRRDVCDLHPVRRRRSASEKGEYDVAGRHSPGTERRRRSR
ncbi:RHTO0S01e14554g1_1 [Rhodotorula toruloides]|uniref:RHTO0S01e14554g1_1 n=2 Tax=Rhodotorula toruloides TaxID=5286 RepID=A0A061AN05_RHOTO|nr:RHTO0S01e14554g1_1 [Rhodotorula toruloides]